MTNQDRDRAENTYADSMAKSHGLQDRCDELEGLNREKTRRMGGIRHANADLAAQVSDMRFEV